jgi:hypothetical protein
MLDETLLVVIWQALHKKHYTKVKDIRKEGNTLLIYLTIYNLFSHPASTTGQYFDQIYPFYPILLILQIPFVKPIS